MYTIFNVANNQEILESRQKQLYPKQRIMHITGLTDVRWSCRFDGLDTVVKRIKAILVSLQDIASSNSKTSEKAAGAYHKMMSSSFITELIFLHQVLAITDGLNKHLQEKNIDWKAAKCELEVCKKLLQNMSIEALEEKVMEVCSDISITTDYEDPIYSTRRTLSDYFKLSKTQGKTTVHEKIEKCKSGAVTKILKELDHRFSTMNSVVLPSVNCFDAGSKNYLNFSAMKPFLDHYGLQLDICDTLLETECLRAKLLQEGGHSIDPKMFPNLQKCLQLSQTIPVNTATVERGFSCMNRVISYTRTSLTTDRASDFMLLSLNKDILMKVNVDDVIKKWSCKKKRLIPLY